MTVLEVYLEQFTDAIGVLSAETGVLACVAQAPSKTPQVGRRD